MDITEIPIWSGLLKVLLECIPYLVWILDVFYLLFKRFPVVECFITSYHKYQGILSLCWYLVRHKDHLQAALKILQAATLSAAVQSIAGYFSHGTAGPGIVKPERWSLKELRENWMGDYSVSFQDVYVALGTHIDAVWQHPFVKAYRDSTDSCWIIKAKLLYCGPERTE